MKKIIYLFGVFLITSCYPAKTLFHQESSHVDYRPYSKTDFFLTEANSVSFEYSPISSVISIVKPGYVDKKDIVKTKEEKDFKDDLYANNKHLKLGSDFKLASPQDALDGLVKEAKKLGANGIINLKITSFIEKVSLGNGIQPDLIGYSATGMAILK